MNKQPSRTEFDENPEWTVEDFARARPASVVHGPEIASMLVRKRGRPAGSKNARQKEQIALRVDRDVLARYKSGGPGWQTRMNSVLRDDSPLNRAANALMRYRHPELFGSDGNLTAAGEEEWQKVAWAYRHNIRLAFDAIYEHDEHMLPEGFSNRDWQFWKSIIGIALADT